MTGSQAEAARQGVRTPTVLVMTNAYRPATTPAPPHIQVLSRQAEHGRLGWHQSPLSAPARVPSGPHRPAWHMRLRAHCRTAYRATRRAAHHLRQSLDWLQRIWCLATVAAWLCAYWLST